MGTSTAPQATVWYMRFDGTIWSLLTIFDVMNRVEIKVQASFFFGVSGRSEVLLIHAVGGSLGDRGRLGPKQAAVPR